MRTLRSFGLHNKTEQRAITLLELMVAFSVLAVVSLSMILLFTKILGHGKVTSRHTAALSIAKSFSEEVQRTYSFAELDAIMINPLSFKISQGQRFSPDGVTVHANSRQFSPVGRDKQSKTISQSSEDYVLFFSCIQEDISFDGTTRSFYRCNVFVGWDAAFIANEPSETGAFQFIDPKNSLPLDEDSIPTISDPWVRVSFLASGIVTIKGDKEKSGMRK